MSDSNSNWSVHDYYSSLKLPIWGDFDKILMILDLVEMVHKINHEVLVRLFLEDFACQLMFFSLFLEYGFYISSVSFLEKSRNQTLNFDWSDVLLSLARSISFESRRSSFFKIWNESIEGGFEGEEIFNISYKSTQSTKSDVTSI